MPSNRPGRLACAVRALAPEELWPLALSLGGPDFAWDDPSGLRLLALGTVQSFAAPARTPFASATRASACLAGIAHQTGPRRAPVAVGGFAFDPARTWPDFGPGALHIPRLALIAEGKRAWAVLVGPARRDLGAELAQLLAQPGSTLSRSRERDGVRGAGPKRPPPSPLPRAGEGEAVWRAAIEAVLGRIAAGEMEKAVLAREIVLPLGAPVDVPALLGRLRTMQPGCIVYGARRGASWFVGATPETLFQRDRSIARTMALAGTTPRGAGPTTDRQAGRALLNSDKDRREHALVGDAIVAALEPLATRVERASVPGLRGLSQVWHLETPIGARLRKGVGEAELLAALHPTPAVCGQPRAPARELLRQVEGFARGWYAGPLGWLDARGRSTFAVAIRSALLRPSEARLFVGAGIVRGSDAEAEWRETETKSRAMRRALEVA